MQQSLGNRATTSFVRGPVQRLFETQQELVDKAEKSLDVGDIKAIADYKLVKSEKRQPMISALVNQGWAGPRDEYALEALWGLYGDGLLDAASANIGNWTQSIAKGAELMKLPAAKALPGKFLGDVQAVALGFLQENETYAKNEMKTLGEVGADGKPTAEAQTRTDEIQEGAKLIVQSRAAQKALGTISVGYRTEYRYSVDGKYGPVDVPSTFTPFAPPQRTKPDGPLPDQVKMTPYADVQEQYEVLTMLIEAIQAKYPALYAVDRNGADDTKKAAEGTPEEARSVVSGAMKALLDNIAATREKLGGKLLYDLAPIHSQLMSGGVKGGHGIDWKNPARNAIIKEFLEDHESTDFWVAMGLSTAAAAAFVVASVATGGLAAVAFGVGLGIGAGQAAASWDKAYDLSKAAGSSTSAKGMLVHPDQVDLAILTAVLDTVFVFVDAAGAGKVLGRAATKAAVEGAEKALIKGLEEVAKKAPGEAAPLVERGILELGVEATAKQTKMSAEQLLKILGEDSASEAAKRLKAFAALPAEILKMTGQDLDKRLVKLGAEIATSRTTGEAIARAGLERYGPAGLLRKTGGWKSLSLALGNDSAVGTLVKQWRDGMMGDLVEFVKKLPGGVTAGGEAQVKRTGTIGKFTNDFDISLLGANASKNRNAVREFMAARTGMSSGELGPMLLADFFTDPNRLHIYDMLKPEIRAEIASKAEKTAEAVIFNKTLADAEKAGNKELVAQITKQMEELGVQKVESKLLGEADRAALYVQQDALHAELEAAVKAGDEAAQKRLAGRLGEIGGQINVAEGGGYFSGGGVAKLVSAKEGLQAGAKELLPAQKYTALLDQLPKLYGDANSLLKAGFVATEDAVSAIKGMAKYTKRFKEIMTEMGVKGGDPAAWENMAASAEKLLKQAKGETDVTLLKRLAEDGAKVEREVGALMASFNAESSAALAQLSRQAGLAPAADLAKIQFLTMANAKYLRAASALRETLHNIVVAIGRTANHEPGAAGDGPGVPPGPPATPPGTPPTTP